MGTASMSPVQRRWLLLALGLCLFFSVGLGSRGLNEPDEGRYANMGRAMALSGDWWEPRMSGFAHYDKPPLIYWATAASFRALGFNEWAARAPSLLGALLALGGVSWAGWRLYGERTAWWAALICGTMVQFWAIGRILSPDMLLTGWCTLGVAAWAECRHRGGAWGWWLGSLACWTLAWWTKATPALIPLAGLTAGVYLTGDRAGRAALRPWLLVPAILVLGAPWYLSMLQRHPELRGFFFGRELAGRMAGRVDGRHGSLVYYVPVSLAGWLPWWPLGAWALWQRRASGLAQWRRRLGTDGWIVLTGLLIFSAAASKLPTYTLTLAPWAALGLARLIGERRAAAPWLAGVFAAVGIAGTMLIPRHESALGVNSSTRAVCAYLRARGATRVEADRYWPGMEFYLGDGVPRYIVRDKNIRERASDPGLAPDRFTDPAAWTPAGGEWLVHLRKVRKSRLRAVPLAAGESWVRLGDFEIGRLAPGLSRPPE